MSESDDHVKISVAPNYQNDCVWLIGPDNRRCLTPSTARQFADDLEDETNLDEHDAAGFETRTLIDEIRAVADEIEAQADGM